MTTSHKEILFGSLPIGARFVALERLYEKCEPIMRHANRPYVASNAVNLTTGKPARFGDKAMVVVVVEAGES